MTVERGEPKLTPEEDSVKEIKGSEVRLPELRRELSELKRTRDRLSGVATQDEHGRAEIKEYNEVKRNIQEIEKEFGKELGDLRRDGWFIMDGYRDGFKMELRTSSKGNKIFMITDTFGDTPVREGQSWSANRNLARTIPESVRNLVINSFTYGEDGQAQERYSQIPDEDYASVDESYASTSNSEGNLQEDQEAEAEGTKKAA